jgi:hypothetical protein
VLLKVKPKKNSLNLGTCTKLAGRFCVPFEILDRIGLVKCMLALFASMNVHNVFHVSLLKKYVHDLNHVIDWHVIQVEPKGDFQVQPVRMFDKKLKGHGIKEDGFLIHKNRVYVPSSRQLRNLVLKEINNVPYVEHPGYQKIIETVRRQFVWPGMKKEVVDYIARCMEC